MTFTIINSLAAALMAVLGLGCLYYCRGKHRRQLALCAVVFLASVALLLGGGGLLSLFDLAWRNGPRMVLLAEGLISGVLGLALTLVCLLPAKMEGVAPALRRTVKGAALLCAGWLIYCAVTGWTLLLIFDGGERVLDYQGQTLVEVDASFLDPIYDYYEYHGPLVRGEQAVYDHWPHPLDGPG